MKALIKITLKMVLLVIILSGCSKDEVVAPEDSLDFLESLKFGTTSTTNIYGLECSISADDLTIASGDEFLINYTIENTSQTDFSDSVYISLSLVYNKPNYPLGQYVGDCYSMIWWEKTSWGRTTKTFELEKNSTYSQSVDITDIGWLNVISSAVQTDHANFYELFETGNFKIQLTVMVDDDNDEETTTVPTVIYSNLLELIIE